MRYSSKIVCSCNQTYFGQVGWKLKLALHGRCFCRLISPTTSDIIFIKLFFLTISHSEHFWPPPRVHRMSPYRLKPYIQYTTQPFRTHSLQLYKILLLPFTERCPHLQVPVAGRATLQERSIWTQLWFSHGHHTSYGSVAKTDLDHIAWLQQRRTDGSTFAAHCVGVVWPRDQRVRRIAFIQVCSEKQLLDPFWTIYLEHFLCKLEISSHKKRMTHTQALEGALSSLNRSA